MYRIIGGDGREYGPVTGDTIRQWVVQNRANAKTLVRPENSSDWRELGTMPDFASSFGAPPPQPPQFPPPIPAAAQSAPPPKPVFQEDLEALSARLTARDYHLDIGKCIGDAFNLLGQKFWPLVGGTAIVMVCSMMLGFIPVLGPISGILLGQVFYAGLYFYVMKLARDERAEIGDAFSGFSRSFGQLVLLSLVRTILLAIIMLPMAVPIVGMAIWKWSILFMVPVTFLCAIPVVYLSVAWIFAPMLVIDRGYEFWDAMELSRKMTNKHWFLVFALSLLAGVIGAMGVIVFIIGIFVTLPIAFASMVYAYEAIFPRIGPNEAPKTHVAPASPTAPAEPAEPATPAAPESPAPSSESTEPANPSDPANPQP